MAVVRIEVAGAEEAVGETWAMNKSTSSAASLAIAGRAKTKRHRAVERGRKSLSERPEGRSLNTRSNARIIVWNLEASVTIAHYEA